MPASRVTSKGQTTIPKEIRKYLHLQPGDKIDFVVNENGKVMLEPAAIDVTEIEGILYKPGRGTVSIEEMNQVIKGRFGRR
jgi:AbrB family looped-hinge helix DNA binding protein